MTSNLVKETVFDGSVARDEGLNGVPIWLRGWQPAPAVYARASVIAEDTRDLFDVAAALRLDRASHCGGPLRLTALPPDTRITSCQVSAEQLPAQLVVLLMVARSTEPGIRVELNYAIGVAGSRTKGNRTIGGRPAYRAPQGSYLELLGFPKAHLTADFGWPAQGYTEGDAATVLGGARVAQPLDQPKSW